jgi:hypothetical protein
MGRLLRVVSISPVHLGYGIAKMTVGSQTRRGADRFETSAWSAASFDYEPRAFAIKRPSEGDRAPPQAQ